MMSLQPSQPATTLLLLVVAALLPAAGHAQISLSSAVDLALQNNPRVKLAQADTLKARAAYSETKDIYIPSLNAGAGLGQSYGYSNNPPTLFTFSAGSLVYSASQFNYIRSARAGMNAAQLALDDVREAVTEDTALTFVALDHDQKREAVLTQQTAFAEKLVNIVTDRLTAGQDSQIDLTTARLTAAQLRLSRLRTQDDMANDRSHLERIIGIPQGPLHAEGAFPTAQLPAGILDFAQNGTGNAAVASAFANAAAKQQQAYGDSHFLYRPQVSLVVQYNRYATFTNSFKQIQQDYASSGTVIGANDEVIGVQISLPLFDRGRKAKARGTVADALHALHEAEVSRISVLDAQSKLSHSIAELQARAEVASLEQQLAQQQLDILEIQLKSKPAGSATPLMTPKDEQNQRIAERDKYLAVVDTAFQLQQAEISLLRQTGHLEEWIHQNMLAPAPSATSPTQPNP